MSGDAARPLTPDQTTWWGQRDSAVRFDWGLTGAAALQSSSGALVVVDVLSFTTTVCVAVGRGMRVHPYALNGDPAEFAASKGAAVAVRRRETNPDQPYSLSPAHVAAAPLVEALVLPSPNGSTISLTAQQEQWAADVVAASLLNARATADWLLAAGYGTFERPITVIAAGERWPDGTLRPAVEDALGAGAVIAALRHDERMADSLLSAEALAVASVFDAVDVPAVVRASASGRELMAQGWGDDVEIALGAASDVDRTVVARLVEDYFTNAV